MHVLMIIAVIILLTCVVIAGVVLAIGVRRLSRMRGVGTAVALRDLPARGDHGWRHGVICYGDESIEYYRLRDIRPGPSQIYGRQTLEPHGRRMPSIAERPLLGHDGADLVILELTSGPQTFEVALESGAATAMQSWLESRPSGRRQRRTR
ncbi:DUF2550 domain-containing protein [Jongsikchunia kroppenstedtii]|uniref:DUF2550 domain-containing protein n=1 Tax=Jongsikchunia kroppenstedtii TaxID=1121721 RepID=UPI00035EE8D4|nr:DUF2550 domain-containing protein [Jongsikchunia kroppenstedtii]